MAYRTLGESCRWLTPPRHPHPHPHRHHPPLPRKSPHAPCCLSRADPAHRYRGGWGWGWGWGSGWGGKSNIATCYIMQTPTSTTLNVLHPLYWSITKVPPAWRVPLVSTECVPASSLRLGWFCLTSRCSRTEVNACYRCGAQLCSDKLFSRG